MKSFMGGRLPGVGSRHTRLAFLLALVLVVAVLSPSLAHAATLVSDRDDYAPGETVVLTGGGFEPGELVVLQVVHDDGTGDTGENHGTWVVSADPEDGSTPGGFVTTWIVCGDDCLGSTLKASAFGSSSGLDAWVLFTDASQLGCTGTDTARAACPLPSDITGVCYWGCGHVEGNGTLQCQANRYAYAAQGTECRPAAGSCDTAETCGGTSGDCPGDAFLPSTTECRAAAGVCDTAETCTGSSAACPGDGFQPSTTECRAAAGVCDTAENCTGSSAACPGDGFQPSTTECRAAAGVCDTAETCTGSSAACPADAFKPSTTVCRADAGECDEAENCTAYSAACPADAKAECSVVTSSSLCPFDVDAGACGGGDQFRLVFTPDVQSWPAYKISSSNPGQTYYNAVVNGTPGQVKDVEITVPYPYVTVGGQALHVYDALPLTFTPGPSGACFVPIAAIQSEPVEIGIDDYRGQNGSGPYALTCIPPTDACDGAGGGTPADLSAGYCTFTVGVTIPASGQAYVNLHLDYGLTGPHVDACGDGAVDRYDRMASDALENRDGVDNGTGDLIIPDCQDYVFGHSCPAATCAGTDIVSSINEFKGIAGVIGQALFEGEPVPELKLRLKSGSTVLASGSTDADGFYLLNYKHKGKAANFTVEMSGFNLRQAVTLKANGFAEVDWDMLTGAATIDYGSGWQPK